MSHFMNIISSSLQRDVLEGSWIFRSYPPVLYSQLTICSISDHPTPSSIKSRSGLNLERGKLFSSVSKSAVLAAMFLACARVQACGLVSCSGIHGFDLNDFPYTGNTYRIKYDQIDVGSNSAACEQFDQCIKQQSPSRGVRYAGADCAFPGNSQGNFIATLSTEKQSPNVQEQLILECMNAVITGGCIASTSACSCHGC